MLTLLTVVCVCLLFRDRDNLEAEMKEYKRKCHSLDLAHTALSREREKLSKEVLHTTLNSHEFTTDFMHH